MIKKILETGIRMKRTDEQKESDFDFLSETKVIGHLKKNCIKNYFKDKKLIGRFDVSYLKIFLRKLPKGEELYIGIYTDKRGIAPLHCKGWLLSPRILEKEPDFDKFKEI